MNKTRFSNISLKILALITNQEYGIYTITWGEMPTEKAMLSNLFFLSLPKISLDNKNIFLNVTDEIMLCII